MNRLLLVSSGLICLTGFFTDATAVPLQQWQFGPADVEHTTVRAKVGPWTGTSERPLVVEQGALVLDGHSSVQVNGLSAADLPSQNLSVEAWVSVDQPLRWGSIVGFYQDNGSFEKGWLLGYQNDHFSFQLSTGPSLITVLSPEPFLRKHWTHVAGTYDGTTMRLYVDGELKGSSTGATGPIDYPPETVFTIGAYQDKDENYPMVGKIQEVRLHDVVLTEAVIAARVGKTPPPPPPPELEFRVRPAVRFTAPDTATVTWESTHPGPGSVAYGPSRKLGTVVQSETRGTLHQATLTGLAPKTVYHYKLAAQTDGSRRISEGYSFDTAMNYTLPPVTATADTPGATARLAAQILQHTGVRKGYCLVYGSFGGQLAYELARQSELRVIGVDEDAERVALARKALYQRGVYGSRVTLHAVDSYARLPLTSCFANLIVSEELLRERPFSGTPTEIARLLRPGGGVACLVQSSTPAAEAQDLAAWTQTDALTFEFTPRDGQTWALATRSPVPGAGEWTHQYGTAGNVAASGDTLSGATATTDLAVQWVGRPGADFGIDRGPRMPAPLSSNGRLFHQGMDRLIALDAYNGTVLWNLEIPDLRRLNLPRDCSNWCVDQDRLYVAVRDRAWIFDAGTGRREQTLPAVAGNAAGFDWGYIGSSGNRLVGSAVQPNTVFEQYWGAASWFDETTAGPGTAKVCSDHLFAYDKDSSSLAWNYHQGLIINSTIAIAGGRVYFVESRHPKAQALPSRRINEPTLWEDQFLVALDLDTGSTLWEKPINTEDGILTFYLQANEQSIILTASEKKYFIYAFEPATGNLQWERSSTWPSADHSGHIQHPVLTENRIYLEPRAFDLKTGEQLPGHIGARSGCTTYIASSDALIYRGANRKISMWNPETGEVTGWTRLRPSCWLSVITAGGLLQVPEGGAGCSCGGWMETSLAFAPRSLLGLDNP